MGNIKGITIEISANTTKVDAAISKLNKETGKLDRELKKVDKALKFNPTSVDLWKQKQELLRQKIEQTEKKLDNLKKKQEMLDASGVDKNSEEYRKLQREIIETGNKLKTFKAQLRQIGNANLHALGESFKVAGQKIEAAGQKLRGVSMAAGVATTAIAGLTVKTAKAADDINTMSMRYGIGTKDLQKYSATAELVDTSVEAIAKSHVRLEKNMMSASQGSKTQTAAFEKLGISITNADGSLRDGDTVWQETIAALGKMSNETERDALAMQLMGKSANELNPLIEDGGEAYARLAETMEKYNLDFLDQETLDRANEFNDQLDTMKAIGTIAFQTIGAELAAYLLPMLEKGVEYVGKFAEWLSNLDPRILSLIAGFTAFLAILAPALIFIGKLATGIGAIIQVGGMLAGVLAGLSPVVLIVVGVIAALIAIGVLLYKNWDTIKAKASELWTHITTVFTNIQTAITAKINAIKAFLTAAWAAIKAGVTTAFAVIYNTITSPFTRAYNMVSTVVKKLKSLFPLHIGKIFSGLKLPHFKVSGGKAPWGIGGKGSLPSWSVDWYAKGGIFNSPSIIGIGEAGSEAVVPLDTLWNKLDTIAQAAQSGGDGITINVYSTQSDPRAVAEEVRRMLIQETNRRRLAWQ